MTFNISRSVHSYYGDMKGEYVVRLSFAGYIKFGLCMICFCIMLAFGCLCWYFVGEWVKALFHATFKFEFRPQYQPPR